MKNVDQGFVVRVYATFKNFAGTVTDPTNIFFYWQTEADGVWSSFQYGVTADIVKVSTGIYYLDIDTDDQSGVYDWRVWGVGVVTGAQQGQFYVRPMRPVDVDPG